MAQLLFTTQDMSTAVEQMGSAAGDLVGRIGGLNAFGVLMPPALEVEVAETTAAVAGALTESSWFYAANAADLAERTALVIAENAGGSIGAALGGWYSRLMSGAGGGPAFQVFERLAGQYGSDAREFYERVSEGVGEATGWLDSESFFIENSPLSVLEGMGVGMQEFMAGVERLGGSGAYRAFGEVLNGLGALDGAYNAWEDTAGEVPVARAFTAISTGGADFAINHFPVTAVANFLDGGALQADADILIQIIGGFISGGPKEAMQQWDNAANEAANGQFGTPVKWVSEAVNWGVDDAPAEAASGQLGQPIKWVSQAVNWTIDRSYGPVSNVVSHVSHTVSGAEHAVGHLASHGLKDLEDIL